MSGEEYLEKRPDKTTDRATMELTAKQRFLKKELDRSGRKENGKVVVQAELEFGCIAARSSLDGKDYFGPPEKLR